MRLEDLEKELNSLIKNGLEPWSTLENIKYFLDQNGIKSRFEPTSSLGEKGKIVLIDGKWIYRFSDDKPGCCIRLLF